MRRTSRKQFGTRRHVSDYRRARGAGLRVANWLAEQGAGTIALLSRRDPSADVESSLQGIRAKGSQVFVIRGDVADAKSLAAALAQLPRTGRRCVASCMRPVCWPMAS